MGKGGRWRGAHGLDTWWGDGTRMPRMGHGFKGFYRMYRILQDAQDFRGMEHGCHGWDTDLRDSVLIWRDLGEIQRRWIIVHSLSFIVHRSNSYLFFHWTCNNIKSLIYLCATKNPGLPLIQSRLSRKREHCLGVKATPAKKPFPYYLFYWSATPCGYGVRGWAFLLGCLVGLDPAMGGAVASCGYGCRVYSMVVRGCAGTGWDTNVPPVCTKSVPFSNNQAERDIRCLKTKQKAATNFQALKGAKYYARIQSFTSTFRKHSMSVSRTWSMWLIEKLSLFRLAKFYTMK